jgi:hypothetical protein
VADNTRVPFNRIERAAAFALASVGGLSIAAILVVLVARISGVRDMTGGAWPAVVFIPFIGLPITLVGIIAFIVMLGVRRSRLARDAGQ